MGMLLIFIHIRLEKPTISLLPVRKIINPAPM